jgi:hypothetical protein
MLARSSVPPVRAVAATTAGSPAPSAVTRTQSLWRPSRRRPGRRGGRGAVDLDAVEEDDDDEVPAAAGDDLDGEAGAPVAGVGGVDADRRSGSESLKVCVATVAAGPTTRET